MAKNIYNWDEKGFVIGQACSTKRIMTKEALKNGRITGAAQDGCREFLSLLACVSADGQSIPPALIYRGISHDLQSTWVQDVTKDDNAYFGASENGWSSNDFGYKWLTQVFEPYTRAKAGLHRRLLIVDGHSSHVNLKFLTFANNHRILIMVMPPHSTHRLQPLDVGMFSPLALKYTAGLNNLMHKSIGMVSMSKSMFWQLFKTAWEESFTEANINSAFAKTGIFPLNPEIILSIFNTRPITPPLAILDATSLVPPTPLSSKAMRRAFKKFHQNPSKIALKKIEKGSERLAAMHSISLHQNTGLIEALQWEKQKRSRGKKLNLNSGKQSGAQFYSPDKIVAARELQDQKDQAEEQRQFKIQDKKKEAALVRKKTEEKKRERAELRAQKQELVQKEKAKKEAAKSQQMAELAACKEAQEAKKQASKASQAKKAKGGEATHSIPAVAEPVTPLAAKLNSWGRLVKAPERYAS